MDNRRFYPEEHTREPWQVGDVRPEYIYPAGDLKTGIYALAEAMPRTEKWGTEYPAEANATRIVACVNTMEGFKNPEVIPEIILLTRKLLENSEPMEHLHLKLTLEKLKG